MKEEPSIEHEVVEANWVKTVGLNSTVVKFPENHDETFTVGHIMQMDIEMPEEDYEELREKLMLLDGVNYVFKSSEKGFHVYNPTIRSLQEIQEIMKALEYVDADYVDAGYDKGSYTLRVANKGDKDIPKPYDIVSGDLFNMKQYTYSKPHLDYLNRYSWVNVTNFEVDTALMPETIIEECKTVGDTVELVRYETRENNHVIDEMNEGERIDE